MRNKLIALSLMVFGVACAVNNHTNKIWVPQDVPSACSSTSCPIPSAVPSSSVEHISNQKVECPGDMTFISGMYCPKVVEHCIKWMDNPNLSYARCAEYSKSECKATKTHKEYCIDTEEEHDAAGMPHGDQSWTMCKAMCESQEKRLCDDSEWTFACEGEEIHPYPYGTGYEFSNTVCNKERHPLVCGNTICDHRATVSEFLGCISTFGVHDLVGNIDEFIIVPRYGRSGHTMRSALKGSHFGGGRSRCHPATFGHDETFHQISTGCRCCADKQ